MFYVTKLLVGLFSLFVICTALNKDLNVLATVFKEDFNTSTINQTQWTLLNETNANLLSGSSLLIPAIDATRAAFLQNSLPFTTQHGISYEVRFRFSRLAFGSGIAFNDTTFPLRQMSIHPGQNEWTIFVWPTNPTTFKVFSVACPIIGTCLPTDNPVYIVSGIDATDWHTLYVNYESGHYTIKLDEQESKVMMSTDRPPRYIWAGNPMTTMGVSFSALEIDYIYVNELSQISIFPYVSQKDTRWASEEYDSAKDWAGLEKSGIDRWGCALTSAVMILQNYGVKAEDGTEIDPVKLNTWLINQDDGYIGPGLINWIAVARYAKDRVPGEKDSLEYVRSYLPSAPILPAILGLPGHFVVAHDEDATSWNIHDPASETNKSLPKTSTVKSINRLVPSSTDLSYILLVKESNIGVTLTQGESTPVALAWGEEYLDDDVEGGNKGTITSAYLPKPNSGKYRISLNNTDTSERTIEIYLYDQDGDVKKQTITIGTGQQVYEINFDKVEVSNSVIAVADTEAPKLSAKTSFSGWYNSPQTAYFTYTDANLRDDYSDPTCVITTEGKNQRCMIYPNICDQAGNCNTQTQISNPANIDITPPSPPRLLWINEYWQRIWLVWNPARDHDRYIVYTGTSTSELKMMGETRENYYISPLLKPGKYYMAISAVDKAGNESPKTKPIMVKIPKR